MASKIAEKHTVSADTGINADDLNKVLYALLNETANHFLDRIRGRLALKKGDEPAETNLTAGELGALISFLKQNGITVEAASLKKGPLFDLKKALPKLPTFEDTEEGS